MNQSKERNAMAKTPVKPAVKPSAKPKAASAPKAGGAAEAAGKRAKKPKVTLVKDVAASKPKKTPTPKQPKPKLDASTPGIAKFTKETTEAIAKLASDILADRIVPTIEQIKAVAAHALGGGKKPKAERKKKKK
jgi:hypothetical protein